MTDLSLSAYNTDSAADSASGQETKKLANGKKRKEAPASVSTTETRSGGSGQPPKKKAKTEKEEKTAKAKFRSRALNRHEWGVVHTHGQDAKTVYICTGCQVQFTDIQVVWDHRENLATKCKFNLCQDAESFAATSLTFCPTDEMKDDLKRMADDVEGGCISWDFILELCVVFDRADVALLIENEYKQKLSVWAMNQAGIFGSTSFFQSDASGFEYKPIKPEWHTSTNFRAAGVPFGIGRTHSIERKIDSIQTSRHDLLYEHMPRADLPAILVTRLKSLT